MFQVISSEKMFQTIEKAIVSELSDIVLILPNCKNEIISKMKWGLFSNKSIFQSEEETVLSYSIIEKAKQKLVEVHEKNYPFFTTKAEEYFQKNKFSFFIDENYNVSIQEVKHPKEVENIEKIIALTLPDSEQLFKSLIVGDILWFDRKNDWLFEYMDIYDEWRYKVMEKEYSYTWQIGGQGRWIQSDYDDYIGQGNLDLGDAGSVYFYVDGSEIQGSVDMY